MNSLAKYEAAKFALSEAVRVDEVMNIRDKAAAITAAARVAKDRQLEIDASEIRIRAERRLGEMIRAQKEGEGLNTGAMGIGTSAVPEEDRTPTLASIGVSKKLSSRSQAIAAIPAEDFETTLDEHRAQQQAVTAATMQKLADKAKEQEQKEVTIQKIPVKEAMNYAQFAIAQLERIRDDDPTAPAAFAEVERYINKRQHNQ